jgi:hypothetical protein
LASYGLHKIDLRLGQKRDLLKFSQAAAGNSGYHIERRVIVSRDTGAGNDAGNPQSSGDRIAKCCPARVRSHDRAGGFSLFDSHR